MAQQSIASYYGQRKRKLGTDEMLVGNKVILIEQNDATKIVSETNPDVQTPSGTITKAIRLISNKKESALSEVRLQESKTFKPRGKAVVKLSFENVKIGNADTASHSANASSPQLDSKNSDGRKSLSLQRGGASSPGKKAKDITAYMMKEVILEKTNGNVPTPKEISANDTNKLAVARKELSLGEIKKRLNGSSRINELKASLQRLNKGFDALRDIHTPALSTEKSLHEFKSIEVLVPMSPIKQSPSKTLSSPLTSPIKDELMSPRKGESSPLKSPIKVPAYKRLASLATPTPSLTLPHHYRWIGEVFRGIEMTCAMLYNRKETITFSKIKPAVQEMLRRNITEKQLSQIKHVCPQMYKFDQKKVKNFGATSKRDEYDLVLTPILVNKDTGELSNSMTSAIVLDRRRSFYNLLLEAVKNHHSTFLLSLDPPMDIPKDKLKRWHPEFDLEHIPDVECDPLPEPPNVEKYSTVQDVLNHVRNNFNCNTRMEKALIRLAEAKARGLTAEEQKVTGLTNSSLESSVHSCDSTQQMDSLVSSEVLPSDSNGLTNPAFKGISKAILDRVRAKQAAKALESMTRSPAQQRNSLIYHRLPELARLVRNLFITEKKSVLPFEVIISKLDICFRTKISNADLTENLRLLSKEVPGWLTFYEFRKTEYMKMAKDFEMNKIISSLEELASKHYV